MKALFDVWADSGPRRRLPVGHLTGGLEDDFILMQGLSPSGSRRWGMVKCPLS
jgi:hypothetical protein